MRKNGVLQKLIALFQRKEGVHPLVNEVFETVQSKVKTLSITGVCRGTKQQNLASELHHIKVPTLLIRKVGAQLLPPNAIRKFDKLLPNVELRFIDECGHVPMMEQPSLFNKYLKEFLES